MHTYIHTCIWVDGGWVWVVEQGTTPRFLNCRLCPGDWSGLCCGCARGWSCEGVKCTAGWSWCMAWAYGGAEGGVPAVFGAFSFGKHAVSCREERKETLLSFWVVNSSKAQLSQKRAAPAEESKPSKRPKKQHTEESTENAQFFVDGDCLKEWACCCLVWSSFWPNQNAKFPNKLSIPFLSVFIYSNWRVPLSSFESFEAWPLLEESPESQVHPVPPLQSRNQGLLESSLLICCKRKAIQAEDGHLKYVGSWHRWVARG